MNKLISVILFILTTLGNDAMASSFDDGMKSYRKNDFIKARRLLEKASKESPNNWRAHYYLANTYFGLGKFESATREYDICIRMCNDDRVVKQCTLAKIAIGK